MNKKEKIIVEINELLSFGRMMLYHEAIRNDQLEEEHIAILEKQEEYKFYKNNYIDLKTSYQGWYSKRISVIKQIIPERYDEFVSYYNIDKRKEINYLTYTISDYLLGLTVTKGIYKEEVVNPYVAFQTKLESQISILNSASSKIQSILNDIEGILQSSLFDDELTAAKDLLKKSI